MRAVTILRSACQVIGDNGVTEPYDQLIIATGSVPFVPPIEGLRLSDGSYKPGVFVFRNLDDCRKISRYAIGKARGAVIGGGLLGLEAARGLQNFELEVHVIHLAQAPDEHAAGHAGRRHPAAPRWSNWASAVHCGLNTSAIIGDEKVEGLSSMTERRSTATSS